MQSAPASAGPTTNSQLKLAGLVLVSAAVLYLCYRILLPFFPALTWAVALTVVARPLHRLLERYTKRSTVSALLTVIVITVLLVLPVAFVTEQVVSEAVNVVQQVQSPEFRVRIEHALAAHTKVANALEWIQGRIDLGEKAQSLAGAAGAAVPGVFAGSLAGLTQLFVALFTVFFFLRDFDYFRASIVALLPLSKADSHAVLERVQQTIDASLRGRVLIAILQGGLGGLMFWLLGLPAPLLWGTVMTLFALVPMLGAFIVWVPAALFLVLSGHPGKAVVLGLWGILVIGVADNLLYPVLVGRGIRMHTIWIFFSVLGGVAAFGASGLVVGPVIFAIADALLEVWTRRSAAAATA
jgi:predicted PurR-regulated permease PerM